MCVCVEREERGGCERSWRRGAQLRVRAFCCALPPPLRVPALCCVHFARFLGAAASSRSTHHHTQQTTKNNNQKQREDERLKRIADEGWDRFAPVSETNKPPGGGLPSDHPSQRKE